MQVNSVNSVSMKGNIETQGISNPNEKKDIKEVIKDNKGKIALALGALAAAGVAAVAISRGKKIPSELSIDDFKKIGRFDKGMASVKGKPFSGVINVTNKNGQYALEYADGALKSSTLSESLSGLPIMKKVYSSKDGARTIENFNFAHVLRLGEDGQKVGNLEWMPTGDKTIITSNKIVKEHKSPLDATLQDVIEKQQDGTWKKTFQEVDALMDVTFKNKNFFRHYILTRDEVGNVIAKKPVYTRKPTINPGKTVLKQVNKYTDKDGNKVVETLKNGKPFAKQTTNIADDGSKQIVVEYLDKGSEGYKKIIDITKEGKRAVHTEGEHIFKF